MWDFGDYLTRRIISAATANSIVTRHKKALPRCVVPQCLASKHIIGRVIALGGTRARYLSPATATPYTSAAENATNIAITIGTRTSGLMGMANSFAFRALTMPEPARADFDLCQASAIKRYSPRKPPRVANKALPDAAPKLFVLHRSAAKITPCPSAMNRRRHYRTCWRKSAFAPTAGHIYRSAPVRWCVRNNPPVS